MCWQIFMKLLNIKLWNFLLQMHQKGHVLYIIFPHCWSLIVLILAMIGIKIQNLNIFYMPRGEMHSKLQGIQCITILYKLSIRIQRLIMSSQSTVSSGQRTGKEWPKYKENMQFQYVHISLSKLKPMVAWKDLITFNCHKSFLPYNRKTAGTVCMYLHKLIQLSEIIHLVKRTHY